MTKLQHTNRLARNKHGQSVAEQQVSIDDSPLPNATELAKLKDIDPSIVPWVMARAEQEQNARHEWNNTQREIMSYDVKQSYRFNFMAIILAFLLFITVIGASVFCIMRGLDVQGTVLGSVAIISGILFFLKVSIRNRVKK